MQEAKIESSELADIKKLMILGLIRSGLTQSQVAAALDVHRTSLSRMFPKGFLSKIAKQSKGQFEGNVDG